jgi:hypothetical protein
MERKMDMKTVLFTKVVFPGAGRRKLKAWTAPE